MPLARSLPSLLILILLALAGSPVVVGAAADAAFVPLASRVDPAAVSRWIELAEDPTGLMDLEAVRALPESAWHFNGSDILRLGASRSAWWLRLRLRNDSDLPRPLVLELASPRPDLVDLYLLHGDQIIASHATGDQRPFATRPLDYRTFALPFAIPPGASREILIRLAASHGWFPPIPLRLWDDAEFLAASHRAALAWGGYYGAILALLAYNLLLFLSTRDRNFLLYVIYLGSFAFWNLGFLSGYGYQFLWPEQPLFHRMFDAAIPPLIHLAATLFVVHYLETRRRLPRLHLLLVGLTWGMQALPFLNLVEIWWPAWHAVNARLLDLFIVLNSLLTLLYLAAGLLALRQGFAPARYFALAWSCLVLGGLLHHLARVPGLLPAGLATQNIIVLGSTLEFLLLALALGDRFNRLREDKLAVERQNHELQLAHAVDLERQVAERTQELRTAMTQVQEALAVERQAQDEQREFLATVSHELRTPLTVIDVVTQNLELDGDAADDRTRQRYARLQRATARLASLLDGYLDEARFSLRRAGPRPLDCDPRSLLEDAAAAARLLADRHRLLIDCDTAAGTLRCDPDLTRLALRGLTDNAVKYTPPGSTVTLRAAPVGRRVGDGWYLEVADDGPGLTADALERLFEPRIREAGALGRHGSGLGLALARRMIQAQGGTLTASGTPGHGSCFRIWLPG